MQMLMDWVLTLVDLSDRFILWVVANYAVNISNGYSNSIISGISSVGNIIGLVSTSASTYSFSFSQVYFVNKSNSYPAIATGSSTDGTFPTGYSSLYLANAVNQTFDECFIWSGINLRIEPNIHLSPYNCPTSKSATTYSPTSFLPSTQFSTTYPPSSLLPIFTIIFNSNWRLKNKFFILAFINKIYSI